MPLNRLHAIRLTSIARKDRGPPAGGWGAMVFRRPGRDDHEALVLGTGPAAELDQHQPPPCDGSPTGVQGDQVVRPPGRSEVLGCDG